ncbi:MAG TPA: hypothetical protein VJ875_24270 [Pyrinomonadaceae bacterium]|nr:hypothetical protein [Pyrinomonadaceae bacterium]
MHRVVAAIIVLLTTALVSQAQTTANNLDSTFGTSGIVRTDFAGNIDQANAVAIQPNGQIVAAGSSFSNSKTVEDFIVARYNANGSLDKRFGKNGKITTDFFRNVDSISAIAIQPDGRIVVAGFAQLAGSGGTPRVFALARYRSDGQPDTSFGNGGALTTSFGGNFAAASAIMVQPDGKIVVAGTVDFNPDVPGSGLDFALARYNASGTLDGSFGKGGKVVFDFFGSFDQANGAVLQPDGKIIVVGSASYDSFNQDIGFALARFNTDGSTDFGFGSGGKQITDFFGAGANANGVVLQPDGKFVVAGTASDTATRPVATDIAVARYNSDGSFDSSFGSGGQTAIPFPDSATEQGNALALLPDGKIIVAGAAFKTFATPPDFALVRYNSDGTIDTGFGSGGTITTDVARDTDVAQAIAIQSDGKVVAAGRAFRNDFDVTLARYKNEVAPTTTDTTPPTAPTGLTATFNSTTNAIDLSWTAATDNVAVTGYRIFRDGGPLPITTVNGTTFSDAGPSGTHSYGVTAIDAAGNESSLSNIASATAAGGDMTPPTAPTALTATANLATSSIELSWTASTDDVGVTGYRVFRDNGATPISTVAGTTFNDPNQLGTHVYAVAAIDAAGNQSALSNSATATVTIPEGSTLENLTVDPTTVTAPASSTGTVTLNGAAPAGGVSITLRSSDTEKATVPPSVTVPEGKNSVTFAITTLTGRLGGGKNPVTITATLGNSSVSATLNILRP